MLYGRVKERGLVVICCDVWRRVKRGRPGALSGSSRPRRATCSRTVCRWRRRSRLPDSVRIAPPRRLSAQSKITLLDTSYLLTCFVFLSFTTVSAVLFPTISFQSSVTTETLPMSVYNRTFHAKHAGEHSYDMSMFVRTIYTSLHSHYTLEIVV